MGQAAGGGLTTGYGGMVSLPPAEIAISNFEIATWPTRSCPASGSEIVG